MRYTSLDTSSLYRYRSLIQTITQANDKFSRAIFFDFKNKKAYCKNSSTGDSLELPFSFEPRPEADEEQDNFFCDADMFLRIASLGFLELKDDIFYTSRKGEEFKIPLEYEEYNIPSAFQNFQDEEFSETLKIDSETLNIFRYSGSHAAQESGDPFHGIFLREGNKLHSGNRRVLSILRLNFEDELSDIDFPMKFLKIISILGEGTYEFHFSKEKSGGERTMLISDPDGVRLFLSGDRHLNFEVIDSPYYDHEDYVVVPFSDLNRILNFLLPLTPTGHMNRIHMVINDGELFFKMEDEAEIIQPIEILESEGLEDLEGFSEWFNCKEFRDSVSDLGSLPLDEGHDDRLIKIQMSMDSKLINVVPLYHSGSNMAMIRLNV